MAKHPVKPLPYANDALKGIGSKTIEIHHDKLYAGYVNKRNEIEEELGKVDRSKANQIYSQMQVGQEKHAMMTLNQSLYSLYSRRLISLEEAMGRSLEPDELRMMIEGKTPVGSMPGRPMR